MTVDLHNPHEDCEGENLDKLPDCTRDVRLGQLSQLQHVGAFVEGLGDELHVNVVNEWDYSLRNCNFVQMPIYCYL